MRRKRVLTLGRVQFQLRMFPTYPAASSPYHNKADTGDDQETADERLCRQSLSEYHTADKNCDQRSYERYHHCLGRFDSTQKPIIKPKCGDGTEKGEIKHASHSECRPVKAQRTPFHDKTVRDYERKTA